MKQMDEEEQKQKEAESPYSRGKTRKVHLQPPASSV